MHLKHEYDLHRSFHEQINVTLNMFYALLLHGISKLNDCHNMKNKDPHYLIFHAVCPITLRLTSG